MSFWWLYFVAYVALVFLAMVIFCFSDPEGTGIFDRLSYFCIYSCPHRTQTVVKYLIGERGATALRDCWTYVLYRNNPIVQIFYLAIIVGGYVLYVSYGYPHMPGPFISGFHKYSGFVMFILCLWTFYKASFSDPGVINSGNAQACTAQYEYDEVMYNKDTTCWTCKFIKPARSKHCRMCGHCVVRFDHHCVWIANCVGRGNHHWFLMFLVAHLFFCSYGSGIGICIISGIISENGLLDAVFVEVGTEKAIEWSYLVVAQYLIAAYGVVIFMSMLCTVMATLLFVFVLWNLYLISRNMTTNEIFKIKSSTRQSGSIYDKGMWLNFRECFLPNAKNALQGAKVPQRERKKKKKTP